VIQWLVNSLLSEPSAAERRARELDQFLQEFELEQIREAEARNSQPRKIYPVQSSQPRPSHRGTK